MPQPTVAIYQEIARKWWALAGLAEELAALHGSMDDIATMLSMRGAAASARHAAATADHEAGALLQPDLAGVSAFERGP